MVINEPTPDTTGLISGREIQSELRKRKLAYIEITIPISDELSYVEDGWDVVRRNKRTLRARKPKSTGRQLEDDVWTLLALAGFPVLSSGHNFTIPVSSGSVEVPPKQIDVVAVDDDTALVVECKASVDPRRRSLQKDLNETRALQQPIRDWINAQYDTRRRVCFVYVTRNIRWSTPDRERAKNHLIAIMHDPQIKYYRRLVEIIGPATRHQLQADLLEGSPIQGLRATVPALRGTFGRKRFYQFAIEPERLLKLAYVSHRAKIDSEAVGTYQRLLKKKRLKDIAQHIDETGGMFPTNIVINFRQDRNLRFDQSGPIGDDPTVLGTLHLPNTYKCAWIIDGQHRLYGFSLSQRASKGKVPVLAFEGLEPTEEVKLFVDINTKQVRVPRNLLVQLEPELRMGPDDPEQDLRILHSELAIDLSMSDESPLYGRISSEWDTDTTNKPVTLTQLVVGIGGSQLVGSVRAGTLYPGHLYDRDTKTTRDRVRLAIEKYLSLFSEGAAAHWALDARSGGFLCTNRGIGALLRLFRAILDHVTYARRGVEYQTLSPDAIVGLVVEYVTPVIEWFDTVYDSNQSRFRGRFGTGGPIIYAFNLMEIIHYNFPDFQPPGLDEHIRESSQSRISDAQQLVTEIEDIVRNITLTLLKAKFGENETGWWRQGVPSTVRSSAASRSETSDEGGTPDNYLGLIDYKKIAEQSAVWRDFEGYLTVDKALRSKSDRLAWMDNLNTIRNRLSHSGRRHVTDEEIKFLENVWTHIGDEWEILSGRPT